MKKSKIYKSKENKDQIISEYKKLFGHDNNRNFNLIENLNKIYIILQIIKVNTTNFTKSIYTPKSKALDY